MTVEILKEENKPELPFTGDGQIWALMQRGLLSIYQVSEMSKWPEDMKKRVLEIAKSVGNPTFFDLLLKQVLAGKELPASFFEICPDRLERSSLHALYVGEISVEKAIILARVPAKEQRYVLQSAKDAEIDADAFAVIVDAYLATDAEYRNILATVDENFDGSAQWAGAYIGDEIDTYAESVEAERKLVKDYIERLYLEARS